MFKKKAQIKRDSDDSFKHSKWDFVYKKRKHCYELYELKIQMFFPVPNYWPSLKWNLNYIV